MNIYKENRSLSPHLRSYKPQITSVISIFHRITGSVLALLLLCIPICINLVGSFLSFRFVYIVFTFFFFFVKIIFYALIATFFTAITILICLFLVFAFDILTVFIVLGSLLIFHISAGIQTLIDDYIHDHILFLVSITFLRITILFLFKTLFVIFIC